MSENKKSPGSVERIRPLNLRVDGFRERIKLVLERGLALAGAGAVAGVLGGKIAENEYRERAGYNPDNSNKLKLPLAQEDHYVQDDAEKKEGILATIRSKLEKVKNMAMDTIKETDLVKDYRIAVKNMEDDYQRALKFGNDAVYWGAFLLSFLVAVAFGIAIIKVRGGPDIDLKLIESKLNKLVESVNRQNITTTEQRLEISQLTRLFNDEMDVN